MSCAALGVVACAQTGLVFARPRTTGNPRVTTTAMLGSILLLLLTMLARQLHFIRINLLPFGIRNSRNSNPC
jgi:hypothetical protein